jgi:hypothetical protein
VSAVEPISADGFGAWTSKLPPKWVSEGITRLRSATKTDGGSPRWKFELHSEKTRFFGLRPGLERVFPAGRTGRFSLALMLLEARNVGHVHAVIREWGPNGSFIYQVARSGAVSGERQVLKAYLTVRESDRVLDPVLLLERKTPDESAATIMVDELHFDEV